VLQALSNGSGEATAAEIVNYIKANFAQNVRVNNTRREVLRNPTLLEFDEKDDQIVRITERGKQYLAVFLHATGST
jgi:hypothetical protein